MNRAWLAWLAVCALAVPALLPPAAAAALPDIRTAQDCASRYDFHCILTHTGTRPAEAHARDRTELIRLVDWDAWSRLLVFLEFTRDRGGALAVRIPAVNADDQDIVAPIAPRTWRAALAAVARYRRLAIHPPPPEPVPPGEQRICITADGIGEQVELVLAGRVERIRSDDVHQPLDCFDPMEGLGIALRTAAVAAVPFCERIAGGAPMQQLEACRLLSGDRMAAADLYNSAGIFTSESCDQRGPVSHYLPSFAADAVLTIADRPPVRGAAPAASAWLDFTCERREFYFMHAVSVAGGTGTVRGVIQASRQDPAGKGRYLSSHADYAQRWTRGTGGGFLLADFTIGAWSPETGDPR